MAQTSLAAAAASGALPLAERVGPLLAEIAERGREIEQARQVPPDLVRRLTGAGFFRAMVPAEQGGGEEDAFDWLECVRRLAAADMSTGWVAGLVSCHAHPITHFPPLAQDEVWSTGPDTLICTSGSPRGAATRVPGGIRLSGRYPFSSGSAYAAWALVGFLLDPPPEGEAPGPYFCLLPRSDFRLEDTWFTSGLRGSGSQDIVIENAFVPEHRWVLRTFGQASRHADRYQAGMFRTSFQSIFNAPFGAIMLGGGEGALRLAATSQAQRVRSGNRRRVSEYAPAQVRLAESTLEIRTAALLMESRWREVAVHLREGRLDGPETVRRWRAEDAFAGRIALRATDRLMEVAGGGSQYLDQPFQRFWRDLHTAGQHTWLDPDVGLNILGRQLLGLPPDPALG